MQHEPVAMLAGRLLRANNFTSWEPLGFNDGWLHTPSGPANLILRGPRICDESGRRVAFVHDDGSVRRISSVDTPVAWAGSGVLLDSSGDTLAATEFCVDHRLPDDTKWRGVREDMRYTRDPDGDGAVPDAEPCGQEPPESTGRWAALAEAPSDVRELVQGAAPGSE